MFRLRRRKGQGAIEYLFMIAAALVIILIAVRYVGQSTGNASQQVDLASLQSQAELAKTKIVAAGVWNDNYNVVLTTDGSGNDVLQIQDGTTPKWEAPAEHKEKYEGDKYLGSGKELGTVYNDCASGGDNAEAACYVLIDLGSGSKK